MDDAQIVELYWQRDEQAIAETQRKYGGFCYTIAMNVLSVREDAEECVNDTWHNVWNAIPPQRPRLLRAFLGKVVRNVAINRWDKAHAQKRFAGMELLLDELADCVPSPETVERTLEARELGAAISAWLRTRSADDRALFIRRYWNGEAVKDLSRVWDESPARLTQRLYRMRLELKADLERNGITV